MVKYFGKSMFTNQNNIISVTNIKVLLGLKLTAKYITIGTTTTFMDCLIL